MTADDRLAHAIATWLPGARWSGAEHVRIERITIPASASVAVGTTLALVDVTTDATTDRYVVPLDETGHDAALAPAFARWLVESALGDAPTPGRGGWFVGHASGRPRRGPAGACTVTPLGTDASNTSLLVVVGTDSFVVKIVRRCRPGVQPAVEIGTFLRRDAHWGGTPELLGWVDHVPAAGTTPTVVATVHEHLPGRVGAWDHLLALVGGGGADTAAARHDHGRVLTIAGTIGRITAEMHRALASRADLPAFAPEFPSDESCRALRAALVAHARRVLDRAVSHAPHLPGDIASRLGALADAGPRLEDRLLSAAADLHRSALIRVHGDYHLGQVLVADDGDEPRVTIIDFEGEPGRPLEERRAKMPAAKDISGMCRSFDYLLRCAARAGGPAYDAGRLRAIEHRFLDGYAAVSGGEPWWPTDARASLEAYRIDKALYELDYEIDHRPEWIAVPLAALEAILATA